MVNLTVGTGTLAVERRSPMIHGILLECSGHNWVSAHRTGKNGTQWLRSERIFILQIEIATILKIVRLLVPQL